MADESYSGYFEVALFPEGVRKTHFWPYFLTPHSSDHIINECSHMNVSSLVPAAVSAAADLPLLALAVVAAAVGTLHDARRPRPAAALTVADRE